MSHLSEEELDQLIAAERAREREPLNDWRTLAARAREEGLIRDTREWRGLPGQPWLQAAAAVLLLVGGIAIGRTTIGLPTTTTQVSATTPSTQAPPSVTASNSPTTSTSDARFASIEEASAALDSAVQAYQRASQYIAANNLSSRIQDSAAVYRARAAAFDKIVDATQSALQTSPHDPVLNQYYLATMGARAATRQVVSTASLRGF